MLKYTRSLRKITIKNKPYHFDGLIRIVESCENFVAVATGESLYIMALKGNTRTASKFSLANCRDLKWGKRGLFYLQDNGDIGFIERQANFAPKIGSFRQPVQFQYAATKGFLPQRIAVTDSGGDANVFLMGTAIDNNKKVMLQLVNSSKLGMRSDRMINFQLSKVHGEVAYQNLLSFGGELILLIVSGSG
jgi:hypothetical protein